MKIKSGFVLRSVGGENIVVPVGEMSKQFHGMINLNDSGAFLWRLFSRSCTVDEAVKAVKEEYGVEDAVARQDVEKFVAVLEESGFVD